MLYTRQVQDYEKSLSSIIRRIEESKHKAITTVNKLLIEVYWFIGETIVNLQEEIKWGDGVVEKLSQDLRIKYPDMNGFSARNLWDCKRFYLTYRDYTKLRTLFAEISWSHNLLLLNKTNTIEEKEFYLNMSIKERWSFRELQRQIDSAYFERFMLSQKTDKLMKIEQDKLAIPDENPSIGLILCRTKKESIVRLTLSKAYKPIKISAYQTKLPDKRLIQQRLERIKLPDKLLKMDE